MDRAQDREGLRVLLVNQYYPPDTSATAAVFADVVRSLRDAGHEVTVLCGRPSYGPTRRPWRPLSWERTETTRVERVGSTALDRRRMPGRILNYVSYLVLGAIRALVGPRPDVVIAGSDPPLAVWVGILAARGAPVVYSLRDLHPDTALASGRMRPGLLARLWERLHVAALLRAELIVCLGPRMADRVVAKGVAAERVKVVPDGAARPIGLPDPHVVAEVRRGAEFVALHAGNVGVAGAWETLAAAQRLLPETIQFVLVGEGCRADDSRSLGLPIEPFRPPEQLPSVMEAGDVQVVTLRPGLEGFVVPSKVYTALAHSRPILAVVPELSDVGDLVRRWGCGVIADPDDPYDVAAKAQWCADNRGAVRSMADRAGAAGEHFDRSACAARFVAAVEGAAGRVVPHSDDLVDVDRDALAGARG
jgi:colanic acid biosynthesis glycosyl transferase WcaI